MAAGLSLEGRFKEFYDIWASFRQEGQLVPDWKNVRPMFFGAMLPEVTLVRKCGPADYRYKLLGSGINQRMGKDPVGVDMLSFLSPEHREHAQQWLALVIQHPCAAVHEASVEYEKASGKSYQGLNLPIRGESGEIDTFIYYNLLWSPGPGEDTGALLSIGKERLSISPVDIGAGVPESLPGV